MTGIHSLSRRPKGSETGFTKHQDRPWATLLKLMVQYVSQRQDSLGPPRAKSTFFLRENFHSFVQLTYTEHLLDTGHCGNNIEITLEQRLQ